MAITKNKKRIHFTAIPTNIIDDPAVSPEAGWLALVIQRWTTDINVPADFDFSLDNIKRKSRMNQEDFSKAWNDLINAGYLVLEENDGEELFELLDRKDGEQ